MHEEEEPISKSQRKRDVQGITSLGERLCELTDEQLLPLPYPDVITAIRSYRKISKGNAKKRQLQYIGKLLRKLDTDPVIELLERYDSSSRSHVMQFHELETWRERLVDGDESAINEIAERYPTFDRPQLRALTRKAIDERNRESTPPVQFRKLFQFLKQLQQDASLD